jgi:two-component system OmpR family sensor kinase
MNRPWSLRRRLALSLLAGFSALWLTGTLIAGTVIRKELDEAFDSALRETAQRVLPLAVIDILNREEALPERRLSPLGPGQEFLTYVVRDGSGRVILESHDADRAVFPRLPETGFSDTATHRIYGEAAVSGTIFVEVADALAHRRRAALEATLSLVAPLALFVPLSAIGVWWLVGRGLRPVLGLRDAIEARGAGDLSPLAVEKLPDEVEPVADAVNRLMERLNRSLAAERSLASNSAHELRTPVAGALAQTQRLIAQLGEGPFAERARAIEASLQRLARISEKLTQLARAEGGGVISGEAADLGPVLDAIVDTFRGAGAQGTRLAYGGAAPGALVARLDPDAFGILIRNLIENALKHSPPGTPVEVAASPGRVSIVNAGPVVPAGRLSDLTRPFVRGPSTAEGSGLGLAIAGAIAANGGIGLSLRSPATGRTDGFEATLEFGRAL